MKKRTLAGVLFGFVLGLITAALIVGAFTGAFITVPKPEIREGEFDFALTYEVDGETKIIEGTYVCEFDGISRAIDGVSRKWIGYIKDHDYFTSYVLKTTDDGVIKVDLDIDALFFMSDPSYKISENTDDPKPEPYIYITSGDSTVDDPSNAIFFSDYEGDDVKIISFEYDAPIENIYK